ncbi:MAG TPA: NADP-dependent oxidoreductase, partial [Tepidisphaeraceae bacterium]|nr:NADP-dependent oxidoreductase [Tepidisphaeraceae bacterium]
MKRALPKTMRAAAIDRFGGPDVLTPHELPVPTIDADEVLIAVHTAGVGSWDADMRGGWWPGRRPPFPIVLGTDGSGTIAAIGSRVRRFEVGEKVYAYSFANPKGGFYAQFVAVAADHVAPIPATLDLRKAGAIPTTGLTALQGIDDALHLKKGETILIHGASGGVGTLAVQFARLRGGRILAVASGRDGVSLARRLGAEAAVDGRDADVDITGIAEEFSPDGLDALLALAGGKTLTQCLDAVKPGGRVAYPNGVEPAPRKRRGIDVVAYDAVAGVHEFKRFDRAVEAAKIKVPIDSTHSLADAASAHERLAAGHVLGK